MLLQLLLLLLLLLIHSVLSFNAAGLVKHDNEHSLSLGVCG